MLQAMCCNQLHSCHCHYVTAFRSFHFVAFTPRSSTTCSFHSSQPIAAPRKQQPSCIPWHKPGNVFLAWYWAWPSCIVGSRLPPNYYLPLGYKPNPQATSTPLRLFIPCRQALAASLSCRPIPCFISL